MPNNFEIPPGHGSHIAVLYTKLRNDFNWTNEITRGFTVKWISEGYFILLQYPDSNEDDHYSDWQCTRDSSKEEKEFIVDGQFIQ